MPGLEEVVITFHGKPYVKIVPIEKPLQFEQKNSLFGIWKDRSDIGDVGIYIESLRKGRFDVN